jgi:hypothetical protein
MQRMRKAWSYTPAQRFLLFDAKFGKEVVSFVGDVGANGIS